VSPPALCLSRRLENAGGDTRYNPNTKTSRAERRSGPGRLPRLGGERRRCRHNWVKVGHPGKSSRTDTHCPRSPRFPTTQVGPSVEIPLALNFSLGWKILHARSNFRKSIPNEYNSFVSALFGTLLAMAWMGYPEQRR